MECSRCGSQDVKTFEMSHASYNVGISNLLRWIRNKQKHAEMLQNWTKLWICLQCGNTFKVPEARRTPNPTRRTVEASLQSEASTANENRYSKPQKPLGFVLGKVYIFLSIPAGLFYLFDGLFLHPAMIRQNLVASGTSPGAGKAIIALVGENLLIIVLGVLRIVSAHGLKAKKPYGYYLTQACLILTLILTLSMHYITNSDETQADRFPTQVYFGILIFLSWFLYFEKRKHMFVPDWKTLNIRED